MAQGFGLLFVLAVVVGCSDDAEPRWADEVVEHSHGVSENLVERFADPTAALGPPDWDDVAGTGAASLGESGDADCGAYLIVGFVDNKLQNGPGPDLEVFEAGSTQEALAVYARQNDGDAWIELGVLDGGAGTIDLGDVDPDALFSQVRLCSLPGPVLGGEISAESAGPDIDAVAAINSTTRGSG